MRGVIQGVKSVETAVKTAGVVGGMKPTAPAERIKILSPAWGAGGPPGARARGC